MWEKKKLLVTSNFFFSHNVFKTCLLLMRQNECLCSKGLIYVFKQDFSMSMILRQTWNDSRLNYTKLDRLRSLELDSSVMEKIWVPDLFFSNEKQATVHEVTVPNKLMHIYPQGRIQYSVRYFSTSIIIYSLIHSIRSSHVDDVDQDQTAQNVQSDFYLHGPMRRNIQQNEVLIIYIIYIFFFKNSLIFSKTFPKGFDIICKSIIILFPNLYYCCLSKVAINSLSLSLYVSFVVCLSDA